MGRDIDLEEQYDKVYRYCFFKVGIRETAEDITQETFLRFLESKTYQNTGKALHYLYTIARNLCIDEYRRKGRKEQEFDAPPDVRAADGMEERLAASLVLREALNELAEEEREFVLLRYANDIPAAVIGRMFGISRFAVNRRLKKSLVILREKMRREDFL